MATGAVELIRILGDFLLTDGVCSIDFTSVVLQIIIGSCYICGNRPAGLYLVQ